MTDMNTKCSSQFSNFNPFIFRNLSFFKNLADMAASMDDTYHDPGSCGRLVPKSIPFWG